MPILILTASVVHLKPRLEASGLFRVIVSKPNKDGATSFPDGEVYVCLPCPVSSEQRVVVLHSGAPHPNRGLTELEMTLAALRREGARQIEVFCTYFPYGMQDKIERRGETNAAEDLFRKLVSFYGVTKVYAIDPHFGEAPWLSPFPFTAVSAHELLLMEARKRYPGAVFVAPDKGHEMRTKKVKGLHKTRTDSYTVTLAHHPAFFRALTGKTVGVVDDLVETGSTLVKFHEACADYEPAELFAVATHGVLHDGIARVTKTYQHFFLSNTIETPAANVDITPLIISALQA